MDTFTYKYCTRTAYKNVYIRLKHCCHGKRIRRPGFLLSLFLASENKLQQRWSSPCFLNNVQYCVEHSFPNSFFLAVLVKNKFLYQQHPFRDRGWVMVWGGGMQTNAKEFFLLGWQVQWQKTTVVFFIHYFPKTHQISVPALLCSHWSIFSSGHS